MNALNPFVLVAPLIALQFVVFGWRITREINLDDQGRRTWLLFSDLLNFAALIGVVSACIVIPLRTLDFPEVSRRVLAGSYVIVALTPFMIAGHYRLFSRSGRDIYRQRGSDVPWMTGQEAFFVIISVVCAAFAALVVG